MTPMLRKACLSLKCVAYGRHRGDRRFGNAVAGFASRPDWQAVQLTDRQIARVAYQVRRYRRQIGSPNLLFWAQRTLAEARFQPLEESWEKQ
jgi:hypothetical protein